MNRTSENTDPSQEKGENLQFDINFLGLIDLLSNHLYRDKSEVLRELLSNASDSLYRRKEESGFETEEASIRLWIDPATINLIIRDNGIGMSRNDLIKYLATIGAGLTAEKREIWKNSFDPLIGRFGVGFLSSFMVADAITVETRTFNDTGYVWKSKGQREYTIDENPDLPYGTTVYLHLKPDIRREWSEDHIKKMILEKARNFAFPIYWGLSGQDQLNFLQAPWYSDTPPTEEDIDRYRDFLVELNPSFASATAAVEIIPLHSENIRGVVYIPAFATFKNDIVGTMDLYCKRVFVTHGDIGILPEGFHFLKGVVDCSDFRLNLARDHVQSDSHDYRRVGEYIAIQVLEHLRRLAQKTTQMTEIGGTGKAESYRMRIQAVMDQFYLFIENALLKTNDKGMYLYDEGYLIDFQNFMPFQSSIIVSTTIPEYLNRIKAAGRDMEVLILHPNEDYTANRAISEVEKREFILVRSPIEEDYLKRYCQTIGVTCKEAADLLLESLPRLEIPEGWDKIIRYYQEQLNHPEYSLSVYLSEFHPESMPGRLLADKDSEGLKRLQEIIVEMEKNQIIEKNDSLYKELERMKLKRAHLLYINHRNLVLERLASLLARGADINLDLILHPMFHDILIAAGHPTLESHQSECQAMVYGELLSALEARKEGIVARSRQLEIEKRLEDAQTRINEAQARAEALEKELDIAKQEMGKKVIATTNEVFFIRSMHTDGSDYDFISKKLAKLCETLSLHLIDPKGIRIPGDILKDIVDYLRKSRFVIADVSEVDNPNIYYEVGYVYGMYANKLVLISDERVIHERKLPFDINTQRVISYDTHNVQKFDEFMFNLEKLLQEMLKRESAEA